MAVIERRTALFVMLFAIASAGLRADQATELRARLGNVANALSAGNAAEAMAPFSKSFKDYEKLRRYFTGLTDAFAIENEVDVLEEPGEANASPVLTVRWAITLANRDTQYSNHRAGEIRVRFAREKDKWQIVEFGPLDLFDPARAQER